MIKIDKSNNIPSILKNEGAAETQRNCNDYDSNPNKYTTQNNVNNIKPKNLIFIIKYTDILMLKRN